MSQKTPTYWTATEAITFLAFGEAQTLAEVQQQDLADYRDQACGAGNASERERRNAAWDETLSAMKEAMRSEKLNCLGRPIADPTAAHLPVPSTLWLSHITIRNDETEVCDGGSFEQFEAGRILNTRFCDLQFKSSDIVKFDKSRKRNSGAVSKQKPSSKAVADYLTALVQGAADAGKKITRPEAFEACHKDTNASTIRCATHGP